MRLLAAKMHLPTFHSALFALAVLLLFSLQIDAAPHLPSLPPRLTKPLPKPHPKPPKHPMSKPTFVTFAGAFHKKEHLHRLTPRLQDKGYEVVADTLLTINNAQKNVPDDVDFMRGILNRLFDQGKEVVFVIHSYAGIPGSAAIKGMSKAERSAQGLKGGIIGVVYICAFVAPEGASLKDMIGGDWAPWQTADYERGLVIVKEPIPIFYNDVPEPYASEAAKIFQPQSLDSFEFKQPPVGYNDEGYKGRIAYIRGEFDQAIPVAGQDAMMQASGVNFTVERYDTGHSPFLSHPDKLTGTLVNLAESFKKQA